mmetsp:Transcript_17391/g.32765  ORF Transcript_17391/g.32765 Transcript_17391/m.32765 type:complete len:678 (+) Transcript_17391:163-2196(+)
MFCGNAVSLLHNSVVSAESVTLLFFFFFLKLVNADLPVHCLLQDVAGEWEFTVSPPLADGTMPSCGHHIPNTVRSMLAIDKKANPPWPVATNFRVNLAEEIQQEPLRHLAVTGDLKVREGKHTSHSQRAFWTMVFDEGFEVRSTGGLSLFAHFHFEPLPNQSAENGDRWDDIAKYFGRAKGSSMLTPKGDVYACHCDRTSSGWWHQRTSSGSLESGCFRATKVDSTRAPTKNVPKEPTSFVRLLKHATSSGSSHKMQSSPINGQRSDQRKFLRKTPGLKSTLIHTQAHVNSEMQTVLSAAEVFESSAVDQAILEKQVFRPAGWTQEQPLSKKEAAMSLLSKTPKKTSSKDLPKAWDWRAVLADLEPDGIDDLSAQFDQGNCGSCYAFSATTVLQMRFRIRLFKDHGLLYPLELSWKSATQCSPYTEGCSGGFAYLSFKHAAEIGLPLAECDAKERPEQLDNACDWSCYRNNSMLFYAKDYGQTGGFAYGADEESIMEEIYMNGPVILSFATSAVPEFIHNSGHSLKNNTEVMTMLKNRVVPQEPSSRNPEILPWRHTTHSILAVGWGEEERPGHGTEKYWLVRNSWGTRWGDQGYAKMRRGHNDAAIETSAPWVQPDMDRLPPGFLDIARKHHDKRLKQEKASTARSPKNQLKPFGDAGKGAKPSYCHLRPNSPDCK